jgi:hypothetical protein
MSDRKVYLLTEEEVSMLRQAGMFTQPQPTFFQALAQDVRCATCRFYDPMRAFSLSGTKPPQGECTANKHKRFAIQTFNDMPIISDPDASCSMWEPQP